MYDQLFLQECFFGSFYPNSCQKVGGAAYKKVRLIHGCLRYLCRIEPFSMNTSVVIKGCNQGPKLRFPVYHCHHIYKMYIRVP